MLDLEVWEHSSGYTPPPADASIAAINSLSPVSSPKADEPIGFPVPPPSRPYAKLIATPGTFLLDHAVTYVRLYPESRSFEVVGPGDYIEVVRWRDFTESDLLSLVSSANLPATVTNERLYEFWILQNELDNLEREEDHYSSLACDSDTVFILPGLSETRVAYHTARAQLILDIFGPEPTEEA